MFVSQKQGSNNNNTSIPLLISSFVLLNTSNQYLLISFKKLKKKDFQPSESHLTASRKSPMPPMDFWKVNPSKTRPKIPSSKEGAGLIWGSRYIWLFPIIGGFPQQTQGDFPNLQNDQHFGCEIGGTTILGNPIYGYMKGG